MRDSARLGCGAGEREGHKEGEDVVPASPYREEEDIRVPLQLQLQLQNNVQVDHLTCPTLSSSVSE